MPFLRCITLIASRTAALTVWIELLQCAPTVIADVIIRLIDCNTIPHYGPRLPQSSGYTSLGDANLLISPLRQFLPVIPNAACRQIQHVTIPFIP
jgi:hypothetical protein